MSDRVGPVNPATTPTVQAVLPAQRLPGTPDPNALPLPAPAAAAGRGGGDVLARAAQRVVDSIGGGNSFNFAFDKQTGMTIVKVYNKATGELVRQIPTEEVVRIAQLLSQEEHKPVLDITA
jgi:flagellar protein FlaG